MHLLSSKLYRLCSCGNVPVYVSLQFMFGCLSFPLENKFVSYYLFTMCKFQLITTNKNSEIKKDKLPRMFTTKTRIRLYRRTI